MKYLSVILGNEQGQIVFLHTDGAKSYKIGINRKDQMPGAVHDYAVHRLKKQRNGRKMKATDYRQMLAPCDEAYGKAVHSIWWCQAL